MADDKPAEVEVATTAEEEPKQEDKSATARKKSLGGLDSTSVLSGPRQRKKADHFQVEVKEKADFVIKAGKGTKLSEIPNVHYLLGKVKTDDELVTSLHNLLYKRPGTAHRRKKNLYEFSGLTFDDDDKEKELEKLQERLGKWTIPLLNGALDLFELPRGNGDEGKKEAKVERLLKFLEEPKQLSEKDLATQAAKKKDAAKAKKEKEQKNKTPKSTAKGGRKSEGGQESTKKRTKREESEEEGGEEPSEEEEEAEPEPEEPPKKRAKKEDAELAKKIAEKKTPPSRKAAGKKRKVDNEGAAEGTSAEAMDSAGASSDLPDDDEIKEATLALLEVSDVNKTTVKDLLAELMEKFGKDLKEKKAFIKGIAVDYAKTKAVVSEDAGDPEADEAAEESPAPAKKQKKGGDKGGDKAGANAEDAEDETKDAGSTDEDMAEPDAEPEAEVAEAEPEVVEAEPEVAEAEPKVAEAEPEVAEAEPEVAEAEPEVAEAEPEEPTAEAEVEGEAAPEANEAEVKATADDAIVTEEAKSETAADESAVEETAGAVEEAKE